MARNDLLMLSDDDLAAMTNRGTVKRAQKEIEAGQPACSIEEGPEDRLLFKWSDGVECEFPAGMSVHDARCSSGALGITRHIVRSVLAYQKSQAGQRANSLPSAPARANDDSKSVAGDRTVQESSSTFESPDASYVSNDAALSSWDPGLISDEALIKAFSSAAITRARTRFQEGTLVELFRGKKPYAIFLDENCFVRFMVPGDVRYLTADCVESALPKFAAMAVWAFRQLPADKQHGLLSLQQKILPPPTDLLQQLGKTLETLTTQGVSQLSEAFTTRLSRLEDQLRGQALVWPAELTAELGHMLEMYAQHDARFDPVVVAEIVGELTARGRAIGNNTGRVPQLLIRGSRADRPFEIESGRYIGLGLGFRTSRQSSAVNAYFQAVDTGIAATVQRSFANAPAPDATSSGPGSSDSPLKTFHDMSEISLYRGVSLAKLAQSQLLLKSGKRTAAGELIMPRSASSFSLNPQAYQWEQLKPPLLAESFKQVMDRLEIQPPGYLGPRRRTQGLYVIPLKRCEQAQFDIVAQKLIAQLMDLEDNDAQLELDYHSRGSAGFDHFLSQLQNHGERVRFVAGIVRVVQGKLRLTPVSLIVEQNDSRWMLIPYVLQSTSGGLLSEPSPETAASNAMEPSPSPSMISPIEDFLGELRNYAGEVLLAGCGNRNVLLENRTIELAERSKETGFLRIGLLLDELIEQFQAGRNNLHHEWTRAAEMALQIALIARISQ